jgi:hypothetical protein
MDLIVNIQPCIEMNTLKLLYNILRNNKETKDDIEILLWFQP